jgi:16S rRNA (guanine527-N7)-methyltransferase
VFGASLPGAVAYADLLAREATLRGLIGPREVPRLWERHLLNCAVLSDLIPRGATVCDLGSGAGLPGIPLALRRPDLQITLLEPLLRRSRFLEEVVTALELRQVQVHRGRAEELAGAGSFEVVTSRAVAPLDRLARWSLPLTRSGGLVLAMKGSTAHDEVKAGRRVLRRLGAGEPEVLTVGGELLADPSTVVRVIKA